MTNDGPAAPAAEVNGDVLWPDPGARDHKKNATENSFVINHFSPVVTQCGLKMVRQEVRRVTFGGPCCQVVSSQK